MEKITNLPTLHEAVLKIMNDQERTYLDEFIIDHEPLVDKKKNTFRYDLLRLIKELQK